MTDANEIADVLDKAHDELLVRGWTQGGLRDAKGRVCAIGAVMCATGFGLVNGVPDLYPEEVGCHFANEALTVEALDILRAVLPANEHTYGPIDRVYRYNDLEASSVDDVLDAFRHAAKKVRNGE